jgi:hypothetical protein
MLTPIPECSVIIPVFNRWDLTRDCLSSLCEYSVGHDIEVIVIDNGSTDETATDLVSLGRSLFGNRFIPLVFTENRNFGPACNAGAQTATSRFLFFLNNDTLLTSGWLPPLLYALRDEPSLGAVGPLLLYGDDTVQHLGAAMGGLGPMHLYQGFPRAHPVVRRRRDLQFITGAALMMAKDLFFDCGAFFEEYRNGFEDVELCIRIREQGKKLRCEPDSIVYHLESQTPGRKCGEEENSALLTRRCGKSCYVDLHHHGINDGFSVFINDMLDISLRLAEQDERDLMEQAEKGGVGVWLRLALENPFWVRGREMLASSLERSGKFDDAMRFRLNLVEIEPLLSRYLDIMRLLPKYTEERDWLPTLENHLEIITSFKSDPSRCSAQVGRILQGKAQGGDSFLEHIYQEKIRQMFPGSG